MLSEEQIQRIKNIPLEDLFYSKQKIVGFMSTASGYYAEGDDGSLDEDNNYKKGDVVEKWILKSKDAPSGVGHYSHTIREDVNGKTVWGIKEWEEDLRTFDEAHKRKMQAILKAKGIYHKEYNCDTNE